MKLFQQFGRRAMVLLLCVAMLTGMLLPAQAAGTYDPTKTTPEPTPATSFAFSKGEIKEFTGDETDVVIPAKINGEAVTKLGQMCFGMSNTAVESIVIPSTVVYYGDYVFDYLYSVTDLYFYGSVPANFADSLASSILDAAISGSDLTVHCKAAYVDDFETAVDDAVTVLGDIAADLVDPAYPEAPSHNWKYTDNGDGTHSAVCTDEGCTEKITNEAHVYEAGVCVCGAKVDPSAQEYYNFELRDGKAWITGYKGFGGEITLPTTYTADGTDYEVVGVAEGAFCGHGEYYDKTDAEALSQITKIVVPASIRTVEAKAFYYVGRYMTRLWSLKEIVFEAENVTFGANALGGNPNLTSVTLPTKLETISNSMFADDTSLTALVIPATVDTVEGVAFANCTALTSVTFQGESAPGMAAYTAYNNTRYPFYGCKELTLYVPAIALEDYQEAWGEMLAADASVKGDITLATWGEEPVVASIPDFKVYVDGTTASSESPKYLEFHVTEFDNATKSGKVELKYVGYNSATATLTIPETVTTKVVGRTWTFTVTGIGANALYTYYMTGSSSQYWFPAVSFPASLEYISDMGCWGLEDVTELDLSNTKVKTIGSDAFSGCRKVETVKLPATVEKMGKDVKTTVGEGENTQTVTYTENVFAGCDALVNIYVAAENATFKDVDGILFTKDGKKLIRYPSARPAEHYDIPEGVETIASQAFMQTYRGKSVLSTVSFPKTLKSIESLAFRQSNLTSVTLPAGVTFGNSCFDICKKLTSVTISEGVTALGDYMFWSCDNLGEITFPASLKTVGNSTFGHSGVTKLDLGKVETIGSYAFYYCDGLTELTIPATLETVGTGVFCNDANIAKVTFEDGCKVVGDYMFFYDSALTELNLADSIESIGNAAFGLCVGLSEVTMPKSLKEMGTGVFYQDWSNLTKVIFPDEVQITELPANTFESCQALTYVYLGANIAATGPVSLYDTNANIVVDCAVAEDRFLRSPFDVFAYDLNNKTLFAKWEAQEPDSTGYPVYKVWLTADGESSGCGGGGATITEDGYVIAYLSAGATPTFRYGTATPEEPAVLTVLEQYEGETAVTVKTYTLSELKAMAKTDIVGYQYFNHATKVEGIVASNLYATISDLLADAGIDFGAGDRITANTAAADFASTLTYEDSEIYKYFIDAEGKTEVPPALLISWNSGTATPEELVTGAYISGNFRFAYGITQEQYDSQNVSGKRLASQVATLTVTHPERVVLNVYEQTEGGEAKLVKGYKPSELEALKTEGTVGYQFWKSGNEQLVAATEYVTVSSLLEDAGLTFATGDTVKAAAADGFGASLTYADSETYKYYITADGKTEVPAALALTWNSGTGTLEEVAATAKNTGNLRFVYGISEQQYTDKSAAGKRLVSNVANVTVVHCGHTDTELRGAKAATCTEAGYTGDLFCKTCGQKLEDGKTVDALGHKFENGKCTVCGAQDGTWENPFKDVAENDWFYEGVKFANQNELFNGTASDTFSPDGAMTRAMLVTVLWRMDGKPAASTLSTAFVDVPVTTGKNLYYAEAVAWAAENGIVNGVDATHFAPEDEVTREQIAAILFRYAEKKGVDTSKRAELASFPDAEKVSGYAKDAMAWAVEGGLVNGIKNGSVTTLAPQGTATRAQVAAILARYLQSAAK